MRMISVLGAVSLVSACTGMIDAGNGSTTDAVDVQIVVRDGALPQAGVQVIFQNADDTVVADLLTDAEGRAGVELPGGGNLTVIRTYPVPPEPAEPLPAEVYTYVGVSPGDRLVLVRPVSDQAPASAINVIVSKTAQGTVKVTTPCGSGQGTAPIVPVTIRGWVEASPGTPDFVISSLAVTRGGPATPGNKYMRTTLAPYAGTSLRMPVLPGAAVVYNPAMGDQVDVSLGLAKVAGGYDAIRPAAFTVANLLDATPMNGQMTLSYAGTRRGF